MIKDQGQGETATCDFSSAIRFWIATGVLSIVIAGSVRLIVGPPVSKR